MKRRIGPYELVARIGYGGLSEVWRARRQGFARSRHEVALKLMNLEQRGSKDLRELFRSEVRISMRMAHANIVQVLDAGEARHCCWLAMELISGASLDRVAAALVELERPMSEAAAVFVLHELLCALEYAHGMEVEGRSFPVIHRDVTPHNVMLSETGDVKLGDFGVAMCPVDMPRRQRAGKLRYTAPEIVRGEDPWPGADLYGAGAIFHELLEGRRFLDALDEVAIVRRAGSPPLVPLRRSIAPQLEALRSRLLEPDPSARIASATEALDLIHQWPEFADMRRDLATLLAELRNGTERRAPVSGVLEVTAVPGAVVHAGSDVEVVLDATGDAVLLDDALPDVADSSPEIPSPALVRNFTPTVVLPPSGTE